MPSLQLHQDLLIEEIIVYCANPLKSRVLGGALYGNKIVKLSDRTVVKFNINITKDKAEN